MNTYEAIVKEVVLTTYFVEAEDEDEVKDILANDGDCPIVDTDWLKYEVVKISKVKEDV